MIHTILLSTHGILRWAILILLIVNIIQHFNAGNSQFNNTQKKTGLFLLISAHTTLLIGLYLWFFEPWGLQLVLNNGMANVMKDAAMRFWVVEHTTGMLIAIVLITMGKMVAKKSISNSDKHKRSLLFYTLALIVILASVPWPFREAVARPWVF